jgi:NADH-quinone oxidoreductase subunit N
VPGQLDVVITQFQAGDIPRLLPEILLLFLAILVIGSDIFERWGTDEQAQIERSHSSALLTAIGLGLIFLITLVQSGYIYTLPDTIQPGTNPVMNFFMNIVRNLQSGGPESEVATSPVLGAFSTDHLTVISRLTFIAAAFFTVLLTLDYRPAGNPGEFYGFLLFSTVGMCLMAGASELILAYLAVELTSIPLYILAGYFHGTDRRSSEAGMKYFLFGALSSGILLYGMSLAFGFTVSNMAGLAAISSENLTQFTTIGNASLRTGGTSPLLTLGMLFIVAGLGYKIAVVPFHSWSPDVYQGAPTPVTAFVSTASKMAGFILLYRLLITTFPGITGSVELLAEDANFGGWAGVLALLTLLTLLVGNLAALPQTNAKRLLAYSSIAHAGFVLLALLAWASPQAVDRSLGTSSMLYYLIVYTVTNIGAFGALAVIALALGGDDIRDLNGLAQRNLGLAVLFAVFVLSLAGVPPLSGFFAKFYVFMAGWESGAHWLVIIAVMTTIIALYYYLRLLKAMFLTAPETDTPVYVPPAMQATLLLTSLLVILLGVYPNVVLPTIEKVQSVAGF